MWSRIMLDLLTDIHFDPFNANFLQHFRRLLEFEFFEFLPQSNCKKKPKKKTHRRTSQAFKVGSYVGLSLGFVLSILSVWSS